MATETFWTLLKSYRVVIPIIQRDYAQGRADERTRQIRETFVGALRDALLKPAPGIELDFLYGTARAEGAPGPAAGAGPTDRTLTLLDGQQRVTTLFLLHWYIASRAGALGDDTRRRLSRFTYETRVSSRHFCGKLLAAAPSFAVPSLQNEVTNAAWFHRAWQDDPTIRAMLTMLDTVHAMLGGYAHAELWNALTVTDAVRFQFLEMDRVGLSDDLYIKMNARGSVLTEFEKFKAWLEKQGDQQRAQTGRCVLGDEERQLLDTKWTDLFWSRRELNTKEKGSGIEIGPAYLRFFTGMSLASALETAEKQNGLDGKQITALNENAYVPTSFYETHDLFGEETLRECFGVLNALMDGGAKRIDDLLKEEQLPFFGKRPSLFSLFVSRDITYEYRLMFHALCRFLLDRPEDMPWADPDTDHSLRRWMRVARNLALNVRVDAASFGQGVRAINALARAGGLRDIYGLLHVRGDREDTFAAEQMKEERLKAGLISPAAGSFDPVWEAALHRAEDHGYFRGRVGFLLDFARREDGTYDPVAFADYAAKAAAIFQEPEGPCMCAPEFWLHRALLTRCDVDGDALISASDSVENYSLGADRKEWVEKVFYNTNPNDVARTKRLLGNLKVLLEEIELGHEKEGLERIALSPRWEPGDWRGCFIHAPQVIQYCAYRKFKFDDDARIFPFGTNSMKGYHSELRSHAFYFHHLEGDESVDLGPLGMADYWKKKGDEKIENNWPCAMLKGKLYKTKIRYGMLGGGDLPFTIEFYAMDKGTPSAAWEKVLTESLGFSWHEELQSYLIRLGADETGVRDKLCALAGVVAANCPGNAEH